MLGKEETPKLYLFAFKVNLLCSVTGICVVRRVIRLSLETYH